jgi:hypothetical protein
VKVKKKNEEMRRGKLKKEIALPVRSNDDQISN